MAKYKNGMMCEMEDESEKECCVGDATRPAVPFESTSGLTKWTPGKPPMGGFRSVINFSSSTDTKASPITTGTTSFKAPYFKDKKEGTY